MDGWMPISRERLPKARAEYWLPWSLWWITPWGLRVATAMLSAERTSSVRMYSPMDQPTTRRLNTSSTIAK